MQTPVPSPRPASVPLRLALVVVLATAASPGPSWGEDEGALLGGATVLPEVTVRHRVILRDVEVRPWGDRVDTVGAEQMDELLAQDLATALDRVPGIHMSRHNVIGAFGGGDGGAIFIRGHGSSRPGAGIQTLFEGVPRGSGIWDHPLLDMLPVDGAESIDVFRGAQPVLLGSGSFGAIDMRGKRRDEPGAGGRAIFGMGGHGVTMQSLEWGRRDELSDVYALTSHRSGDGHRPDAGGTVDASYLRYGEKVSDTWSWSFQLLHSTSQVDDPGMVGAPALPLVETFATRGDLAILSFNRQADDHEGVFKAYLDAGFQDWRQWDEGASEPFSSVTDYANYGFRTRHRWTLPRDRELVLGLDHDFQGGDFVESHPSADLGVVKLHFRSTAPYALLAQSMDLAGGRATLSAGLRVDDAEPFGTQRGSQEGLRWERGRTVLHLRRALGYDVPGVFVATLLGGGPGGTAWRSLRPERIDHLEWGWTRRLSPRLSLALTRFDDEVRDGLRAVFAGGPPSLQNLGDYRSRGWESTVSWTPDSRFELLFGGTWSDTTPDDVPYVSRRSLLLALRHDPPGPWRASLDLRHVEDFWAGNERFPAPPTLVNGHALVNFQLTRSFHDPRGGREGEWFLSWENLGDANYELKPGYPMPGRWVLAGVRLKI